MRKRKLSKRDREKLMKHGLPLPGDKPNVWSNEWIVMVGFLPTGRNENVPALSHNAKGH